ncbi:MFS transporter [Devosia sp. YIM 151766]|uniref:MFS transporter n=1 Tax=Devosia sp. YIM 151766 TaxID=3017325 RepID=UPI00255C9ED5|nr:MFS transporter [Devosia sp. YIM 151766]WIY53961.1 MFS transporter [Devosia sp. YIM 151766]
MSQTSSDQRTGPHALIPPLRKRLAFAAPEVSVTILFATVNSWYFYYLVSIVSIHPLIAGLAFIFGRVVDAILDPLVGRWVDTNKGGYGRKKIIVLALPLAAITFVLLWIAPLMVEGALSRAALAAVTFAVFALGYTFVSIPRLAMLPKYETDHNGRTAQIGTDTALIFLSLIFAIAGVPALITLIDGASSLALTEPRSWWFAAAGLAAIAVLVYIPFLLLVPEQNARRVSEPFKGLWSDLRRAPFVPGFLLMVAAFFLSVLSMVSIQSILPFYLESYIGVQKDYQALILGTVFLTSILALPFWVAIGRRLGKPRSLIGGLLVFMVFLAFTATITPGSGLSVMLFVVAVLAGFAISALSIFPWSMVPDAADQYRITTGTTRDGLSTSIFTFSNKLAGGCAVLLNGALLSVTGHISGKLEQNQATIDGIFLATICVPLMLAVFCLIATLALSKVKRVPSEA